MSLERSNVTRMRHLARRSPSSVMRGATLIELIVSIVIVGVAVSGILLVMNQTVTHSADPIVEHQAVAIAEAYLEEVLLQPYDEAAASGTAEGALGPDSGETSRANYDDVNDYDGLGDSGARSQAAPSTVLTGLGLYSIDILVVNDGNLGPSGQRVPSAQAELVTVTVTHPTGVRVSLGGYRTSY